MATKSEVTRDGACVTGASGHLDTDTHPDLLSGQSQDQKVCFYYHGTQCWRSTTVTIQECEGFYIYKLPNTPLCYNRYCGAWKITQDLHPHLNKGLQLLNLVLLAFSNWNMSEYKTTTKHWFVMQRRNSGTNLTNEFFNNGRGVCLQVSWELLAKIGVQELVYHRKA